jgi:hypothetical protein
MQHVQGTGTTTQPQDEYKLSWLGNDPPHFVCVVHSTNTQHDWADTLVIPTAPHDDDKSTTPTVCTSGRVVGGD